MAGKRWDVLVVREYESNGEKKSAFTRIGVMFESRDGNGFTAHLDAVPIDGKLIMRVPRERDGGGQQRGSAQAGGNFNSDVDDDLFG